MANEKTRDTVARDLFLQKLRGRGHQVEADTVIARENVYRVDGNNYLMVRTSRFHERRAVYFFGLTRHIFENFAQLPHAIIAFVFSDTLEAIVVPADWMWQQRDKISADSKQYNLEIDKSFHLKVLRPAGEPIDLAPLHERFEVLNEPLRTAPAKTEDKRVLDQHSELQGMLLEIGNLRGFQT